MNVSFKTDYRLLRHRFIVIIQLLMKYYNSIAVLHIYIYVRLIFVHNITALGFRKF